MPGDLKGQYMKKFNGALFTCLGRTTNIFYFSEILKKLVLCVYGKYSLWRKK